MCIDSFEMYEGLIDTTSVRVAYEVLLSLRLTVLSLDIKTTNVCA